MYNKIVDIYYTLYRFVANIPYYLRHVKWSYQRVRYGFSDKDLWSFDHYLSNVIVRGLTRLKSLQHGYPTSCKSECEWYDIMEDIIYTFEINKQIVDNLDIPSDIDKERYERGWKLFREYYNNLWD